MPGVAPKTKNKVSKSSYRRNKKKALRANAAASGSASEAGHSTSEYSESESADDESEPRVANLLDDDNIVTEYDIDNPLFEEYKQVFLKFRKPTEEETAKEVMPPKIYDSDENDGIASEEEEKETVKKLSKKARKKANQVSIADLKSMVKKPELVEWTDVRSSDPRLLIAMKGMKNIIPVPSHWSLKREYLSSKRGIEKPPFQLPKFIQETGIMEMRDAVLEKQEGMTLKQRQRERVQGKTGKLDIDYGKLYDAFFRRQTKPEMTGYGEVYYEGKEYETNLRHLRPGELSDELKAALNMEPGGPPPWLINQQRWGLPPSYPNMKIPGVNAPIPPGASWGYQAGQWGRVQTDENGRPQFGGDIHGFAELQQPVQQGHPGEPVEKGLWGQLRPDGESDEEEEEEEISEDEEDEDGDVDMAGVQTSMTSASAFPSEMGGTESIVGEFTLRKQREGISTEEPRGPRSLYQVLPEKEIKATGFFGGEHAYDLDADRRDQRLQDNKRKRATGDVDVSVDVDALGDNDKLDKEALRNQYDAQKKAETQGQWQSIDQDDLSEMIAAESRKRVKREEERRKRR